MARHRQLEYEEQQRWHERAIQIQREAHRERDAEVRRQEATHQLLDEEEAITLTKPRGKLPPIDEEAAQFFADDRELFLHPDNLSAGIQNIKNLPHSIDLSPEGNPNSSKSCIDADSKPAAIDFSAFGSIIVNFKTSDVAATAGPSAHVAAGDAKPAAIDVAVAVLPIDSPRRSGHATAPSQAPSIQVKATTVMPINSARPSAHVVAGDAKPATIDVTLTVLPINSQMQSGHAAASQASSIHIAATTVRLNASVMPSVHVAICYATQRKCTHGRSWSMVICSTILIISLN
jgi:hypothetical protein